MEKQTAVEWLEKNIKLDMNPFELIECFNKAIAMEKEQIMNAWLVDGYTDLTDDNWKKEFEQYYNETYNNE